jgi:DNA-binding GntR family transcriptional regulator
VDQDEARARMLMRQHLQRCQESTSHWDGVAAE